MKLSFRSAMMAILIGGPVGILLYSYLHFSETSFFPTLHDNLPGFLWSSINGMLIGLGLYLSNNLLNHLVSWQSSYVPRFLLGYLVNYLLAIALCFGLATLLDQLVGIEILWIPAKSNNSDIQLKVSILLLAVVFIYNVIYTLLYAYRQYAVAQVEQLQRDRKQLELQFETLKGQLSPHYLFNSLNTISALIHKDPLSAEQFVRRLALTYQYILSTQQKKFVTLKEEVDFVQSYYYLLRIRFQQHLQVEINLPANIMNSRIPPLTLQILVENAIKHNRINSENKLFIYIAAQDNTYLRVINSKSGNQMDVQSFKVGLENIKKRYAFFTDKKIEIIDSEKFVVALPVIHEKEQRNNHLHSA